MVSYKNLFLIKGMTCWNGVTDWFRRTGARVYSWYESAMGWFDSCAGSWYIHPDGVFPLPHLYRYGLNVKDTWRYEPETGKLVYGEDSSKKRQRVSWLSARVKRGTQETKDMDRFLADLHVYPNGKDLPVSVFLQAWSIYDRQWWTAEPLQIEWIDSMAEEHSATVTEVPSVPLLPCVKMV
jgi:hypothetical protein